MGGRVIATIVVCGALLGGGAAPALASVDSVFGGRIACVDQSGVRVCDGDASHLVPSWDGAPIDLTVAIPAVPVTGPDGNFPLIGTYHGWGGQKVAVSALVGLAKRGYVG